MSKINIEVSGISIDDLIEVMHTGLESDEDAIAWEEYCRAEHGAFAKELSGSGGVKVSGKAEKGRVSIKGGSVKAKGIRLNRALYALHLATAVVEVSRSTGFECMMVDVSPLCREWKERRDAQAAGRVVASEVEYVEAELVVE